MVDSIRLFGLVNYLIWRQVLFIQIKQHMRKPDSSVFLADRRI